MSTSSNIEIKCFTYIICFLIIDNLSAVKAYLKILSPEDPVTEADLGSHLVLHCNISGSRHAQVVWFKDGQVLTSNLSWKSLDWQGSLVSKALILEDAGNYTCRDKRFSFKELNTVLFIKTPPSKLVNVTVHPSTVVATVRWHVRSNGGYPITHFTLLYRPENANASEPWHIPQPEPVHISPSVSQYFVHQLKPATEYVFRLWANNKLGAGEPITVHAATSKPINAPEVLQHIMANTDDFSSEAWVVAISMVLTTVLVLSCLSCILIYKENRSEPLDNPSSSPRIITNPGFDINLEECYLLDHADYNDNTERAIRINNNTIIQPSRV